MVSFQVWDVLDCLLYGDIFESFDFEVDGFIGMFFFLQFLQINVLVQCNVGFVLGWNWIFYNVEFVDFLINIVFGLLIVFGGGLIKGQFVFS